MTPHAPSLGSEIVLTTGEKNTTIPVTGDTTTDFSYQGVAVKEDTKTGVKKIKKRERKGKEERKKRKKRKKRRNKKQRNTRKEEERKHSHRTIDST